MQKLLKLVKGLDLVMETDIIMFCFPFAGGGASVYRNWNKELSRSIQVCPIQLPGREDRISEEPYLDMEKLIEDIVKVISRYNNEIILYGHSMGSKIAYEVYKCLKMENREVKLLIVSGGRPPHILEPNPIYQLSNEAFKKELVRFEGTPKEILENEDLVDFFLPMIRADFTLDETYYTTDKRKVNCPLIALGGEEDQEADIEEILGWKEYAENEFQYQIFHGGHFFIREYEREVLSYLNKKIAELI